MLVRLDLSEVRVRGDVEREAFGEPVLHIDADFVLAFEVCATRLAHRASEHERLDPQVPAGRRGRETFQVAREGEAVERVGTRDGRPIGCFVVAAKRAPEVDAPRVATRLEAEGPEGDLHLERPAVLDLLSLDAPDRIPGGIDLAPLIGHLAITPRAFRVCQKDVTVSAVPEGVEDDLEDILRRLAKVLPDVVDDGLLRIVQIRRDVQVGAVVGDPDLRLFRRGITLSGLGLDEATQSFASPYRLGQPAVDLDGFGRLDCANPRPLGVGDRVGKDGLGLHRSWDGGKGRKRCHSERKKRRVPTQRGLKGK